MPNIAKHVFGTLENVETALKEGRINEHDILFLKDSAGNPHIGWIDQNGQSVIATPDLSEIEAELELKVSEEQVETRIETVLTDLEKLIDTKIEEVEADTVTTEDINSLFLEEN